MAKSSKKGRKRKTAKEKREDTKELIADTLKRTNMDEWMKILIIASALKWGALDGLRKLLSGDIGFPIDLPIPLPPDWMEPEQLLEMGVFSGIGGVAGGTLSLYNVPEKVVNNLTVGKDIIKARLQRGVSTAVSTARTIIPKESAPIPPPPYQKPVSQYEAEYEAKAAAHRTAVEAKQTTEKEYRTEMNLIKRLDMIDWMVCIATAILLINITKEVSISEISGIAAEALPL